MFLLILIWRCSKTSHTRLTFQYVSINTWIAEVEENKKNQSLHSNMFLLILSGCSVSGSVFSSFTFQYVSIHTIVSRGYYSRYNHLTFQYVSINTMPRDSSNEKYPSLHSNMFLLILVRFTTSRSAISFTFQYVSINTSFWYRISFFIQLYIPICFY
mgnify:CR=1 FL=1